jgi:hypothetical protein
MSLKGIPCGHSTCSHTSGGAQEHLMHGALHFTASVMGNPEYLQSVRDIPPAKDERMVGIERVNSFHAAAHEKRTMRQIKSWGKP